MVRLPEGGREEIESPDEGSTQEEDKYHNRHVRMPRSRMRLRRESLLGHCTMFEGEGGGGAVHRQGGISLSIENAPGALPVEPPCATMSV
jgi:hypothetical protein